MKHILILVASMFIALNTNAYTECTVKLLKIHVGDGGAVYLFYEGGGAVSIPSSDPNQKNVLSVALAAFMADKRVIVRYNGDNVSCDSSAIINDFKGLWILKN